MNVNNEIMNDKEIIEAGLTSIIDICNKMTSGNISHNVCTIKYISENLKKIINEEK